MSCIFAWARFASGGARPAGPADPPLIASAIEELLRYESPLPAGIRYAVEDVDLGDGLVVPAGAAMHVLWSAANLDPNAFEDPLTVKLDRGRTNHPAFASGKTVASAPTSPGYNCGLRPRNCSPRCPISRPTPTSRAEHNAGSAIRSAPTDKVHPTQGRP